jgi:hypothetical protein
MYHANVTLTSLDAAYVIVTNLTCLASLCGCMVVMSLYLMYPDIRTTARKLVVCLSCANFLQCITGILQVGCLTEGWFDDDNDGDDDDDGTYAAVDDDDVDFSC